MKNKTESTIGIFGIVAIASMFIGSLGLPDISETLGNPCGVYKKTIFLCAAIVLMSGTLSFVFLKSNKLNSTWSLSIVSTQTVFLAMFSYGMLFLDDCVSCFAFLTRSCQL